MTARLIMKMAVCDVRTIADGVRVFSFRHPRRPHLPPPLPGSHVDLHLPNGRIRQYSLCGDPGDDTVYQIAVKREDGGRGGSRWIHEHLAAGSIVPVSAPRNNFPLAEAEHYVFIAGGIGITPILPMARLLARRNASFELHYCAARRAERAVRLGAARHLRAAAADDLFLQRRRAAGAARCRAPVENRDARHACLLLRTAAPDASLSRRRHRLAGALRSLRGVQADARRKLRARAVRREARLDRRSVEGAGQQVGTRCAARARGRPALIVRTRAVRRLRLPLSRRHRDPPRHRPRRHGAVGTPPLHTYISTTTSSGTVLGREPAR